MSIKTALITILSCVASICSHAQYENVWAFGRNAGIDFNVNPPQAIHTEISTNEGSASITDVNGQLLFYTDGTSVWDRNHAVMPNGTNLTGLNDNITASTSQGALIVPKPGSLGKYYIFSMGCWECGGQLGRLSYSIVDMSLNNGLGDVVKDSSGILLDNIFTEHMTAVAGNNCDIWLMTLSRQNNGQFQAYNINVNGINPVPVISPAVPFILGTTPYDEVKGYMDISPNRKKLAIAKSNLILYDFNPATGALTHPVILINQLLGNYGVAFSPDNTKLYVQDVKIDFNNTFALLQFDLSSGDSLIMVNSRNTIDTTHSPVANVGNGAIKRGPDGKIYCARRPPSFIGNTPSYLGIINKPDLNGIACDFVSDGLLLKSGTFSTFGLPNSNSAIFEHYTKNSSYNIVCGTYRLSAMHTDGAGYRWEDGTTGAARTVDQPGIYWVRYQAIGTRCVEVYTDTFKVLPYEWEHHTSAAVLDACWQDTITVAATYLSGADYLWQDGITGPERAIAESGTYWLTYHEPDNECKNYADTFHITIPDQDFRLSFDIDSIACQHHPVAITNTSPSYYTHFAWHFGSGDSSLIRDPDYTYRHSGNYEVVLTGDHNGSCADTLGKTVIVDTLLVPSFIVQPQEICMGERITIRHHLQDSTVRELSWQYGDGSYGITQDSVLQHAYARSGIISISLNARYRACPEATYADTVIVHSMPLVDLGEDAALCLQGAPIMLQNHYARQQGERYLWSTGAVTPAILVNAPGKYTLTVSNDFGCSTTESIEIKKDCYMDIPNAFTPNGDGENDYFLPRQLLSGSITHFRMQILNRWGQLVFETQNTGGRGWDGKFNGKEQPGGVYVYIIDVGFANGKGERYEGNVTLLR